MSELVEWWFHAVRQLGQSSLREHVNASNMEARGTETLQLLQPHAHNG